jgi:hypothetical protein
VVPTSSSRRTAIQRQLKSLVTENLPVKFSALFFAVVLWEIVLSEEPSEAWIDVHLALTLDSAVTMASQPPNVEVLVSGRGRELLKLYSAWPELRRSVGLDDTVFAVHPSDVYTPNEADVKILDVRPHMLRLPLARVAPVNVRPASGNRVSP